VVHHEGLRRRVSIEGALLRRVIIQGKEDMRLANRGQAESVWVHGQAQRVGRVGSSRLQAASPPPSPSSCVPPTPVVMVVVVGSEEGKREKRWVDEEGSTPNHHLAITKRTKQARKGKLQKTEQQPCAGQEGAQQHTGDDWQSRKERSSSSSSRRRRSMMMVVDDPSLAQPEVPSPQHNEQDSDTMSQSEGLTGSSELCPTRPAACMACIEWGEGEVPPPSLFPIV